MSPLPARFADRWGSARDRPSYRDAVCWHVLLGGYAEVREAAASAQGRLARFGGLHMTPLDRLHMTVMRVGAAGRFTRDDMERMTAAAQARLARVTPVTVTLSRVIYHPEAIALRASPAEALEPLREAAGAAAHVASGAGQGDPGDTQIAHVTLAYSTGEQDAAPVIAELGTAVSPCRVTIREMSLVVQDGPERLWDWRVTGTARLLGSAT